MYRENSDISCAIIQCPNDCGAEFHTCKLDDHLELCNFAAIACIYYDNGCKIKVQRNNLSNHIKNCSFSEGIRKTIKFFVDSRIKDAFVDFLLFITSLHLFFRKT